MAITMERPVAERNTAMFPLIFITSEPSVLTIAGWGLLWLLLGYAIRSSANQKWRAPVRRPREISLIKEQP